MNLQVLEFAGHRVLTSVQLAQSYETSTEKISYNFNYNKKRYTEGKHYFALEGQAKRDFLDHHEIQDGSRHAAVLYLWSEKGAWLHAKSLNTDRAWEAYETLVDDYYRVLNEHQIVPNLSPEVKAIFFLDQKTQEIEYRVQRLEVSKTVDYGQQLELQNLAKRKVVESLGGKDGQAYQKSNLRGKVFSAIWRDFKDYFNIESYKNTLVRDLDKAKEYIGSWRPQGKLLREIEEANRQMSFS